MPAFAGMTWSAGMTRKGEGIAGSTVMTGSVEMRVGTEVAPEACNSSPGNANLRIGTQAGHDEGSHSNPLRKYALRHTPSVTLYTPALRPPTGVIPAHAAVTSTPRRHPCARRRYVHPPGVIPAHAAVTSTHGRHPCTRRRYVHPPASFLRRQES